MATETTVDRREVVDRRDVLRHRFHRHQLHRQPGTAADPTDVALLGYGVQDTGVGGAGWALANRGAPAPGPGATDGGDAAGDDGDGGTGGSGADGSDELALAWTLRGAPHAYRRADLAAVALATAPLSEADAAKRIYDASKPLKAAGLTVLEALATVAHHLRDIVTAPTVKGEVSSRLTELVDPPFLRECRPCDAVHVYEMPFRLAALQAGLELVPGTSPPVLRRIPGLRPLHYGRPGGRADPGLDVVRNHLRFYAAVRARDVAGFLDAPVKDVKGHWPDDAVAVEVTGIEAGGGTGRADPRFALAEDLDDLAGAADRGPSGVVRLLGPYDPYLQLRDRELLVADEARRKDLWRVLGRPGAVVADGEVLGTWRPKTAGRKLTVRLQPWGRLRARDRTAVEAEAERLAAHRGLTLAAVADEG